MVTTPLSSLNLAISMEVSDKGCSGCDGDLSISYDLEYMHNRKYCTLEEWQKLVLAGIEGKKVNCIPLKIPRLMPLKQS